MTYEEALNFDQKWTELQSFNDLERYLLREEKPAMKAVAIAMRALEKQIPKKPVRYSEFNAKMCPSCGQEFGFNSGFGFCENCNQATVEWYLSEYKDKTAHWEYDSYNRIVKCSVCGRCAVLPTDDYMTNEEIVRMFPYCHCGAKMS